MSCCNSINASPPPRTPQGDKNASAQKRKKAVTFCPSGGKKNFSFGVIETFSAGLTWPATGGRNRNQLKKATNAARTRDVWRNCGGCVIITGEVRKAAEINTFLNSHLSIAGDVAPPAFIPPQSPRLQPSISSSPQIKIQRRGVPAPSTKKVDVSALILRCGSK